MSTTVDGPVISPTRDVAQQTPPATPAAVALLTRLATDHPTLAAQPARERLLAAAWLAGYRSARTRRAYALDLTAQLDWLHELDVDVLAARCCPTLVLHTNDATMMTTNRQSATIDIVTLTP